MNTARIATVDAFTAVPFRGNPAAVCLLPAFLPDHRLQEIAAEMNLSETAFLVKQAPLVYDLRWFTPMSEVDLCGHATLACAHMLREYGEARPEETITFRTCSGELRATYREDGIELDFPMLPGTATPITEALRGCLGVPIRAAEHNGSNLLVEVKNFHALTHCRPNLAAIAALDAQGLIVTTASGCGNYDFASRYFAPQLGIAEDPVCGSAHCMLAPYWAAALGRTRFRALQASARSGVLDVRIEGDRVHIAGQCVTTLRGMLELGESHALDHAA